MINPTLYGKGKLPYDEEKDFIPITGLVRIHQALLGHPSLSAKNVRELIALAGKKPGELTYGTAGIGSALHMNMVLFESMAGLKLQPVHYRGAAPALADLIGGHVSLMSLSVSSALPPFRSGDVKIFGIGSLQRLAAAPDIPTAWPRAEFPAMRPSLLVWIVCTRGDPARHLVREGQQRSPRPSSTIRYFAKIPRAADLRADGKLARGIRGLHPGAETQMEQPHPRAAPYDLMGGQNRPPGCSLCARCQRDPRSSRGQALPRRRPLRTAWARRAQ